MTLTGPTCVAPQERDLERAATSYETHLALRCAPASPTGAAVFNLRPASSVVREPPTGRPREVRGGS